MPDPAFTFEAKGFIADYKTSLDQFIADLGYVLHEQKKISGKDLALKRIAEDILQLQKKSEMLTAAPLAEDLIYDIEIIQNLFHQEVVDRPKKHRTTLHSAAVDYTKDLQSELTFIMNRYLQRPADANRLIEELEYVSEDFQGFLRVA